MASSPDPQRPDHVTPKPAAGPPPPPASGQAAQPAEPDDALLTPGAWLRRNGVYLVLAALVAVALYRYFGLSGLVSLLFVAVGLGLVIFVHELGHFAVAKWCDVYVQTFSIGFGPALPGCLFKYGETVYKIAAFPLGGYVQMLGEGTESEEDENNPRSYKNKPVGQRMMIISAGVVMNVLLALVCFIIVFMAHGKDQPAGEIGPVEPGNRAWEKGIPSGAVIVRIGNRVATPDQPLYFSDLMAVILNSVEGQKIPIAYDVYEPIGDPAAQPKRHELEVEPRKGSRDLQPIIGVWYPATVQLLTKDLAKDRPSPCLAGSAAAAARKAFPWQTGDLILATTDPDNPGQLADLPRPKAGDAAAERRYTFELSQRFQRLAGKPMTVRILRQGADKPEELATEPAAFQWGDVVVATTDPARPDRVADLPPDPRNPTLVEGQRLGDYFELRKREQLLAGRFMVFRVRHADKAHTEEDLLVPPAYHLTLGTRMRMGKVAGIREGSAAEAAGVQKGDILKDVVLYREGHRDDNLHLAIAEGIPDAQLVDPVRLPDELRGWADAHLRAKGDVVKAVLTVTRDDPQTGKMRVPVTLAPVDWDRSWEFDNEDPRSATSPLAVPELGLAYQVDTVVEDVAPDSPAAEAGLRKNDVILALQFKEPSSKAGQKEGTWYPQDTGNLPRDYWTSLFYYLQVADVQETRVRLERGGQPLELTLTAAPDGTWPLAARTGWSFRQPDARGLLLTLDQRLQKADNLGQAVVLGFRDTYQYILDIYSNLRNMVTGRISYKNMGGPITIATMAYASASMSIWDLLFFLGVISVNLAVINFLPIPFLDGGHMVFLLYEKVRGRPATEQVQAIATYAGLLFLAVLMFFVIYLDIKRVITNWF